MTNEEAIHRLDDLRRYRDLSIGDQKALATAIQALENGCKGCKYEETGNNTTYPCSYCGRCYTDKYKAESEG